MSHQASASTWRRNGIRVSALAVGGESCVATWGLADCIKEDIYSLANKRRICYAFRVVLRTCTVAVKDLREVEHSVEVTAETLYEAIATALAALQQRSEERRVGKEGRSRWAPDS